MVCCIAGSTNAASFSHNTTNCGFKLPLATGSTLSVMLLLLLVYYISQATFTGSRPIGGDDLFPSSIAARASGSSCPDAQDCRMAWNIVWSCLVTIFSCTWVSVHPNIPRPVSTREMSLVQRLRHSLWEFLSNRMLLFVIALLVPEYILAWAIRQHLRAHQIAWKYKDDATLLPLFLDSNWTVTHGFFVIMGGFHLFEPPSRTPEETRQLLQQASVADRPNSSVSRDTFCLPPRETIHDPHKNYKAIRMLTEWELFSSNNDYQFILPTEDEIKDRGKSDWLAKSFVLIQTTWFLTQCFAQGIQHLPITELEIVTGAYAMMNFAIYFFWWKKPLNTGCPVRVINGQGARSKWTPTEWQRRKMDLEYALQVIIGYQDRILAHNRMPSAPMFWADCTNRKIVSRADTITLLIGLLFGAVHCLAWSFLFPSHTEIILWRISCAALIAVPFYVSILGLLVLGNGVVGGERLERHPWVVKVLEKYIGTGIYDPEVTSAWCL
ncbi:hypothetical protein DFH08DRAFT_1021642 [Mycena albidolilacea]|uniref:Uncharacterized protein n=1 Tax=Mycena albidolilacea TaxID=1033008 RepID=A0AAD6ZPJ6_9AGAR|nr:hypothetical protein DFH08DRAFT_1021642 [Mycena albidolilacea]